MEKIKLTIDDFNVNIYDLSEKKLNELREKIRNSDKDVQKEFAIKSLSIVDKVFRDASLEEGAFGNYFIRSSKKSFEHYVTQYSLYYRTNYNVLSMNEINEHLDKIPNRELTENEKKHLSDSFLVIDQSYATETINKSKLFSVITKCTDSDGLGEYIIKLNPESVLSKACFKKFADISMGRLVYDRNEKCYKGNIRAHNLKELFAIERKTNKYDQEYLKTILDNRVGGLYRGKSKVGMSWNEGGISAGSEVGVESKFIEACRSGNLEAVRTMVFEENFNLDLQARKFINSLPNREKVFDLFDERAFGKSSEDTKVVKEKKVQQAKM